MRPIAWAYDKLEHDHCHPPAERAPATDRICSGSLSCADHGRLFGTISCLSNCNVDYGQCYGGCTIYKGKIVSC